jgi:hypothetical protein
MTIKLSKFMSLGTRSKTLIPTVGFDLWEQSLLPFLPLVYVTEDPETKEKTKQKRLDKKRGVIQS